MEQISILQFKIDFKNLQDIGIFFIQTPIYLPLIIITIFVLFRFIVYWLITLINKNKYWKVIYLPLNLIKSPKYWGMVYDEKNNIPIPFAKVKLIHFSKDGEVVKKSLIATTISNKDGKYYFNYNAEFKNLFIEVYALGYKRYYKEIDTLEHLKINEEIVYDVALIPANNKFNSYFIITAINKFINFFIFIFSTIGLIISIYNQLTVNNIESFIFSSMYIFLLYISISGFLKKFTLKKFEVLESVLMQKIPGAVVRLYDNHKQLHLTVTNKKGYILLDWIPGQHQILITKRGFEMIDENTGTKNRKLYLSNNNHVKLKKKFVTTNVVGVAKDIKVKTSLTNPFSNS